MTEKQSVGPPSRPPPPGYLGAPPPYMEPQGATYPMSQPGETLPYGAPPPPYYNPPPHNQAGYPPPGGFQVLPNQVPSQGPPPPGYPGGQSLYPDLTQLPQPQAVPLGFMTFGGPQMTPDPNQALCGVQPPAVPPPSAIPVRSAPPPPPTSQQGQVSWWANLKEGEAPPGCVISWKGGDGLNLYFIQEEGHIVSPKKPLQMALFKKINGKGDVVEESLVGMVEVLGCWRLRLHGKNSFTLHTYNDTYVFLDDSTCPSKSGRFVIVELPADVSKTMRADLLALLNELTDLREEQEGVVGKITTNVETVYSDITKKLNTAVKDVVPGAHKSTKWLRKGTGSLVRMGGNIVSKGMHLIADQMPANQATEHEEESPIHTELMEALITFHKSKEAGSITYI